MATQDLIAAMIAQLGTAQPERDDPRRDPAWAPLDDRDTDGLLATLRALAGLVRHYPDDPEGAPPGNWQPFMPALGAAELDALAAAGGGRVAPHHALLLAFLRRLARPQAMLNAFTGAHLAWQMREVLGFVPQPPQPDRAHLVFELKKNAAPALVDTGCRFGAGKDARQVEQVFAPVRATVVGAARVEQLASLRRDGARLLFAPVANSADGLGAPLAADAPRWPPFGRSTLPPAPVGFAIASPVLRLAEGERTIRLKLRVGHWPAGLTAADFAASFEAHLTGPKGWIGPIALGGTMATDRLTLTLQLGSADEPVVDHDAKIHLHAFPSAMPVVQCLLKRDSALGFAAFEALTLSRAQVTADVAGMRTLTLENDDATLNPKKAFLPFGPQPAVHSRFAVGCPEALGKTLSSLTLHLTWQGAPADLLDWYANYTRRGTLSDGVGASVSWIDANGTVHASPALTLLPRLAAPTTVTIAAAGTASAYSPSQRTKALHESGSRAGRERARAHERERRVWNRAGGTGTAASAGPSAAASARRGFVTFELLEDLLHADFRADSIAAATPPADPTGFVPKVLNVPYTPKVQEITLDYSAHSDDSRIGDADEAAFTDTALQFFQVDALGIAREHAWLTAARPWAPQGAVALLPAHPAAGELMIGLSGLAAGDEISLLLQVAEGSADPLAEAQALQWSVLADNAWRVLGAGELTLDSGHGLRTSGLLAAALPAETSTDHTRAPAGWVWLRAAIPAAPAAACDIVGVHANAAEVAFVDQGNDPQRLAAPLPARKIARIVAGPAALKSVSQPYASFGGALAEGELALARRASERLRHRDRAITGWDVERLVLQNFPGVFRAKCITHASDDSWLAAGHASVVLVPDLRNANAVDPLQPRVDLDTLVQVREFLAARAAPQVRWHVRNPRYQPVQLDFKVRLRAGFGFAFYSAQIDAALRQALSPWAFDSDASLGFGAHVLRSALLDFVERLPYVDFVTDFRLGREGRGEDLPEIAPSTPDEILVSAAAHRIEEWIDG